MKTRITIDFEGDDAVAVAELTRGAVLVDLDVAMAGRSAVDVTSIIKASKAPAIDRGMAASIRTAVDHARDRGSK